MEDRYGSYYYQGSGLWRSLRDGDFEESEVWDVLRERRDPSFDAAAVPPNRPTYSAPKHSPSSAMTISKSAAAAAAAAGVGSSNGSAGRSIFAHQSAPVNIPNWSGVQKTQRSKSSKALVHSPWNGGRNDYEDGEEGDDDEDEEDDDEGYGNKLPPHEYIAMRLARSKISSFSVFEGVGRKLKGRDLSKVRNDVLTKTGFLESP